MTRELNNPLRWILGAGALALLILAIGAGQARAASYPPGGGAFNGSAEGWSANGKCNLELIVCTSDAHYSGAVGNPPGSLVSETNIFLTVLGLFHGEFAFESPAFTVASDGGGQGAVSLQRSFVPQTLVKLGPELTYTATLLDKTNGTSQVAFKEATQDESAAYVPRSGAVAVVGGHTYAIAITGQVASTVELLSLVKGSTLTAFDNVMLTGPGVNGGGGGGGNGNDGGNGGEGSGGGNGAGGLNDSKLESLLRSSLTGTATVKGGKVLVKAKCPKKVGVACRVTLQGMLKKGRPATAKRTVKIARGKSKKVVLKVKPKLKKQVAKRKSLLFKETVKAAKAKATVYKTLKLIRR